MRSTDCMCFGMKLSYSELKFCVLGKAVETQLCQAVNKGYLRFFSSEVSRLLCFLEHSVVKRM